ncbi:hypothetical protein P8452_47197 [Trifolium repens]|jgi:hypothetical protein|nr:hypothetical protein P8452_47197 [Trifolium repens]
MVVELFKELRELVSNPMTILSLNHVDVARMHQIVDELKPIRQILHLAGQGPFALGDKILSSLADMTDILTIIPDFGEASASKDQLRQQL